MPLAHTGQTAGPGTVTARLPNTELVKLQAGLREVLGEDGVGRLSEYLSQEEHPGAEANKSPVQYESATQDTVDAATAPFHPPDWLKQWRKHNRGQPWGFVVFRTALYDGDDDGNVWQAFQQRFDAVIKGHLVDHGSITWQDGKAAENYELGLMRFALWVTRIM